MHLDSARELKQQALKQVLNPMLATAPQVLGLAMPATSMKVLKTAPRLMAIGVAPAGKDQYKLAIRIQRRQFAMAPEVERLRSIARGEVDVRFIGRVHKRAAPWQRARQRPLLIGCSVAHYDVTAGTLGAFVRTVGKRDEICMLSNNHVLANENDAAKGDAVLQPGPYDAGRRTRDHVATLERFVRLRTSRPNLVDAAIARLQPGIEWKAAELRDLGKLKGAASDPVEAGARVAKLGRTTGLTRGRVTAFELDDVVVGYDIGNISFDNQIEIEGAGSDPFSDGGDSGSLIIDSARRAVGLLFAGSDMGGRNGKGLTYANPIAPVLEALKLELLT